MNRQAKFRLEAPRLSENDIERACLDLLWLRGYYVLRLQSGLFRTPDGRWVRIGEPGLPDYAALHPRYPAFFLEVKRPGAKLDEHQQRKIWEIEAGYQVKSAVVNSSAALSTFLAVHETKNEKTK
jgi:hypothetical protein